MVKVFDVYTQLKFFDVYTQIKLFDVYNQVKLLSIIIKEYKQENLVFGLKIQFFRVIIKIIDHKLSSENIFYFPLWFLQLVHEHFLQHLKIYSSPFKSTNWLRAFNKGNNKLKIIGISQFLAFNPFA